MKERPAHPFWEGFLRGLSSAFDFFGYRLRRTTGNTLQGTSRYKPLIPLTVKEAFEKDREAIRGDFEKVCGDLRRTTDKANEIAKKQYPNVIAFPGGWPRKGRWPQGNWPRRKK